jgi:DNA-binding GntR family transcriptional regulator
MIGGAWDDDSSEGDGMAGSQTELVYERVRDRILSLQIVPGAPLSERGLEAETGASRTPVREALLRLSAEGLVAREGRGWRTTPIDLGEIAALTEFRAGVEALAARLACERATDDELSAFADAAAAERDEVSGEREGMRRGSDFHGGLAALSGNPFVEAAVQDAITRMARARWLELRDEAGTARAWREHAAIVESLVRRDAVAAVAAIEAHSRANLERLLGSIRADRLALGAHGVQLVDLPAATRA